MKIEIKVSVSAPEMSAEQIAAEKAASVERLLLAAHALGESLTSLSRTVDGSSEPCWKGEEFSLSLGRVEFPRLYKWDPSSKEGRKALFGASLSRLRALEIGLPIWGEEVRKGILREAVGE